MHTGFILFLTVLFCVSNSNVQWQTDDSTASVTFNLDGPFGGEVNGSIKGLRTVIDFDPLALDESTIFASVDISTIKTGNVKRDKHIQDAEWFNSKEFPMISLKSKSIEKEGKQYIFYGELSMKGKSVMLEFPFSFKPSPKSEFKDEFKGEFRGEFKMNRLDFEVGEPSKMVSKDVTVKLVIPVKQ